MLICSGINNISHQLLYTPILIFSHADTENIDEGDSVQTHECLHVSYLEVDVKLNKIPRSLVTSLIRLFPYVSLEFPVHLHLPLSSHHFLSILSPGPICLP